ncbi:MAG: hypothetical protein WAQ53_13690 [Thiofilum sp.]|uniref:hypothetical protein n=1 Tax=Thiofilum sp. TaxID=2212733 RepID=UPI0025DBA9EC|nr:hypothetical protein [Thiofilum sp.]MBK8453991.1 hypothetical protein [Thiofilum sp.]
MQFNSIQETLNNPITQSVIAAFIYAIIIFMAKVFFKYIKAFGKVFNQKSLFTTGIVLFTIYIFLIALLFLKNTISAEVSLSSLFGVSIVHIIFLYRYIYKLRKIGIIGSDLHIKGGFSYLQKIKASKTNFQFLGVGARKLTINNSEFEKMIERVNKNGKRVQLLLCHPNSEALRFLALRAHKSPDDYSHKVNSSLEYLAKLVLEKDYGIDIRFYHSNNVHDMPIFRIVIINSSYCLVSYTQFNDSSHEGELMPQIHFFRNTTEDTSNSFYFAFSTHFERLWKKSEDNIWNPQDFLIKNKK